MCRSAACAGLALVLAAGDASAQAAVRAAPASVLGAAAAMLRRLADEALVEHAVDVLARDEAVRGASGRLRVLVWHGRGGPLPVTLPPGVGLAFVPADGAKPADTLPGPPSTPGAWTLLVRAGDVVRVVPDLVVLTTAPLTERRRGRIGDYLIGSWPAELAGRGAAGAYRPPAGLAVVTPENRDLRISRHLRLGDFLTRGQDDVWPKYVALDTRVVDKLELTVDELEAMGHTVRRIGVISAFRTPWYNANGGNTAGRGSNSRHMYGDALDFYIDTRGDGRMDDLNGDGRIDIRDARIVAAAAERVQRRHPHLVGGIGVYRPTGAHGGFVHIDVRGVRARW
jgi:hypothetical protein